jgi:hypothetical protein
MEITEGSSLSGQFVLYDCTSPFSNAGRKHITRSSTQIRQQTHLFFTASWHHHDGKQQSSWSNSCAQLVGYNSCAQVLVLPALQQEEQQSRTNMVSGSAFDRDRSL